MVIKREPDAAMREALARWARAATRNGYHFWAQISHAGRQTQKLVNPHPKAPSTVKPGLPGGQFSELVALTIAEIEDSVRRFATCAAPAVSVLAAARQLMAQQEQWLASRRAG